MFDAETPEGGVTHKKQVKETTVVVTRVVDKDGEVHQETQVTENKRMFIDGDEVKDAEHLKQPDEHDEKDDHDSDHEKKHEDGEGGPSADSPEPDSPSKSKVKKKKSFKDALKKRFSKRGKDDHEEEVATKAE